MTYQRRAFLKTASLLTSGIALTAVAGKLAGCKTGNVGAGGAINRYGLQLYTLRDVLPKDPKGTLKQVSTFGYK